MAEERITVAYVQAPDKAPLMPCHSYGRVKRWLKLGRARIVSTHPFTVRLNYELILSTNLDNIRQSTVRSWWPNACKVSKTPRKLTAWQP